MHGDIYQVLQQLNNRLMQLENENTKLKEKVENIKPIVIENINYKIQELHVKELKGTLNVGLTGTLEPENFEELAGDINIDTGTEENQIQKDRT